MNAADVQWELTLARFDEWLKNDLFRFSWWALIGIYVICLWVWWKKVDKSRLSEIMIYIAIVTLMILAMDELGEELTLWDYPVDIIPLFPPISAIDLSCLPILYAFIYQYFKTWKSYSIASLTMSVVSCFVLEPLFVLSGIYQMITWKGYYGLLIYFLIAMISRAMVLKINLIEQKRKITEI